MAISDERAIELADELAWHLFDTESDAGELKKSLEYYRTTRNRARFIQMLRVRSSNPRLFQRSKKTRTYYQEMNRKVSEMLNRPELKTDDDALRVLGWAFRLMQFYSIEKPSTAVTKLSIEVEPGPAVVQLPMVGETERRTGTVKRFDARKRYGFIQPDDGKPDVFVHLSQVVSGQPLQEDQWVSFITEIGPRGPRARDVRPE